MNKVLHLNPRPVNRLAARVMFGDIDTEHFSPSITPELKSTVLTRTFRVLPIIYGVRPAFEKDWSGFRNGRMTAHCYYGPHDNGAVWLVRCDCGNYEARRPDIWDKDTFARWIGNDACRVCRTTDVICRRVPAAKKHDPLRRDKWIAGLMLKGLAVNEIAEIMTSDISTEDLEVNEIRAILHAKKYTHDPDGKEIEVKAMKAFARKILFGNSL